MLLMPLVDEINRKRRARVLYALALTTCLAVVVGSVLWSLIN